MTTQIIKYKHLKSELSNFGNEESWEELSYNQSIIEQMNKLGLPSFIKELINLNLL